ncbi:bifunctional UDP-N-acetylglucosamine diphosphorylase/glucosamine-1-phosphate N-acetyltransferase GlmU [Hoyosella sp. YIM 151337]|uniref:bifunctional UDP-N-acetylglucosamine diphosphorylase/glucosamine-1-phosphate N-acetyltransferase GlmU n=1 Tax=Hoyosella sp. YIM 151337 TaxID=2992742 RepID=UPI00223576F1|nr:bifunctional UDP-N-acetylglucosamine diphosphorylase/glucosamine-1-phosphate N-acetyltransferase GlmU [Hoyosella sp. YIM 151337]MCW4352010.1 bifunctional UDP-N-acetylglucosamine diphosphorylase/glucosamine-1-phosphate N-acetyltransferase GlmU [Hoyosella sp. YIM 151337]
MPQTPPAAAVVPGATSASSTAATAVIVLAAGAGTRMKSDVPKVLHTLCGRSMIGHALAAASAVEPHALVAVVGHQRERVTAAVKDVAEALDRDIAVAVQEEQNGTGHAVGCGLAVLPPDFAGTVLVTAGDVPMLDGATLLHLVETHLAGDGAAVTALTFTVSQPRGYGRILRTDDGAIAAIVEEADATDEQRSITEVNAGVYAFDAQHLRAALSELSADNAQGELYLTDVIEIARNQGRIVRALHLEDSALVAGVNDRVQLAVLRKEMNRRIVEHWMREGVSVIDPDTTWIDVGVRLGRDATLLPNVQLHGSTVIGDRAEIGPDTTLADVTVGADARVIRSHGERSAVGAGAVVGPFAYLRPKSVIGDHAKIGAYVETKNADIGSFTKVPHLTYVGDATIGEHTNIGASSVFVNYDGINKTRTVVGSHVRAGSDTMFIAPVHVGDGAYTGAGTVLREDVPPGALAISGGRQRNIEGWVDAKRPGTAAAKAAVKARNAAKKKHNATEDGGTE